MPPNLDEKYLKGVTDTPGVYIFKDEQGLQIYIGKSGSLKSRIKSHFTQAATIKKEMKVSMQSHKLEIINTSNDLEALLLESRLIKENNPILNRKLRRIKSHFVLLASYNPSGYLTVKSADKDLVKLVDLSNIYGMYTSKAKVKAALENQNKVYSLCPKLLGLEKASGSCFQYQLGRCNGACIGRESYKKYNALVNNALVRTKIEQWPFTSAIALGEGTGDMVIVDNWIIQGYLSTIENCASKFRPIERSFDVDTYRILRSYITRNKDKLFIKPFQLDLL